MRSETARPITPPPAADPGLASAHPPRRRLVALIAALGLLIGTAAPLLGAVSPAAAAPPTAGVQVWGGDTGGQSAVPADAGDIVAVDAGDRQTLGLRRDGTVVAWGADDGSGAASVPKGLSGVVAVAAGTGHSLALKRDGTVVAWGSPGYQATTVPQGLSDVTAIAAGSSFSLALRGDGTVVAWGANTFGESTVPQGLSGVTAIATGLVHSLAVKSDGTVVGWGDDSRGQSTPPAGLTGVVAVSAGYLHSMALKSDGTVVTWGNEPDHAVPAGLKDVVAISAGWYHDVALKRDGSVVNWGQGFWGQLAVPSDLTGVTAVATGSEHTVTVRALPAFLADAPPSSALIGAPFSSTFATSGYATFTVTSGALPDGLSLTPAGVLAGTPTTAGRSTFTVTARNAFGATEGTAHSIVVQGASAATVSGDAPDGTVGVAYSAAYTVAGTPAPTVTAQAGTLPPGLELDASGRLSGTPTSAGTYPFTVRVSNASGEAEVADTVVIYPEPAAPSISGDAPGGKVDVAYDFRYTVAGTPTPAMSLDSGALPPGLTLDGTGLLSVTPTSAGTSSFVVLASSSGGSAKVASTVTVVPGTSAAGITGDVPAGVVGSAYDFTYSVSGSPAPTVTLAAGALPPGLSLDGATGRLSGTPTTAGTYSFSVQATNSDGWQLLSSTLVVSAATAPPGLSGQVRAGTVGAAYDFAYTVTGSPAPTVTLQSGALPPGLALDPAGRLTGTPTTAGSFPFTVAATSSAGSATVSSVLVVAPAAVAPAVSGGVAAGIVGSAYDFTYTVTGTPAPAVSLKSGALPPGLALAPSGRLSGTPTTAGTFTFEVVATSSAGSATASSTLTVSPQRVTSKADLRVDLSAPSSAVKGRTFALTVVATNAGPAASSSVFIKVILPPNVQFVSATGTYTRVGNLVIFSRSSLANGRSATEKITVRATTAGRGTALASTFSLRTPDPSVRSNTDTAATTVR